MTNQTTPPPRLVRELSVFDALMINIGTILASAIFIVPATITAEVQTPLMSLLVWVVAGVLSWCGAVTFAELAVLFPDTGGEYVYLEKAYHPLLGFLYGWTLFAVIQTASIAAVSVGLMTYVAYFVPLSGWAIQAGAIALILGLSVWNCYGLRVSSGTQNSTTVVKLAMVAAIAAVCFLFGGDGASHLGAMLPEKFDLPFLSAFGTAMVAALWAYDGWISITFVGGEVRNPSRFLPRSLGLSVLILIGIYVALSLSFAYALPLDVMKLSPRVAADSVERALGGLGGGLVALAVIISCFAAVNGFIFTAARVYFAMACDGRFFRSLAKLHPKTRTPVNSILWQGVWASLIALTGTYDQLFTYVVVVSWLFYALGAAGVIVLRNKAPDLPRPYRAPLYPWIPLVFVVLAAALLLNTLITDPRDSLIGIGITAAGIPLFLFWNRTVQPAG